MGVNIKINRAVRNILKITNKVHYVLLEDINIKFYIRTALDDDRVLMFSELIESGVENALLVTEENHILIDGRTRHASYDFLDRKKVPCVFCNEADEDILIAAAFLANSSPASSKPPDRSDIKHTMELLIKAGSSKSVIKGYFEDSLGGAVFERYYKDVQSKINKYNIRQARNAVAEEKMDINTAVRHYGVSKRALKIAISGIKEKEEMESLTSLKTALSRKFRNLSTSLGKRFSENMKLFEGGDLSEEEFRALLQKERDHLRKIFKAHEERVKRFRVRTGE